ncbi:MAG: hypothetical protein KTR21_17650 [Rhodobacteraceae bacterium]|nr:hypothetical protein [Paracoccaceae bacterium]
MSIAYDPAPHSDGAAPSFPPLLTGVGLPAGVDPLAKAATAAGSAEGVEAGTIFWSEREDAMDAAIALAPETPLAESMAMVLVALNGLGDSLGALTPPEVAVTWEWPDLIKVNGARVGVLRADAATRDTAAVPDWLAVGVTLQLAPISGAEPGEDPTITALWEEGCVDLTRTRLLESWSRHMLVWINRWMDDGFRPVHDSWVGRVERRGEAAVFDYGGEQRDGMFLGLDEQGGMLLKTGSATEALSLTQMLDHPRSWPPKG